MKKCLLVSNHTHYQFINYNSIEELPVDWITKLLINVKEVDELPKSLFEDNIPIYGLRFYSSYKCFKGYFQYFNCEAGFKFNTGSYFYIRFLNCDDAMEYAKKVLKLVNINFHWIPIAQPSKFKVGDVVKVKSPMQFIFDAKKYSDMYNLKDLYFEFFNKQLMKESGYKQLTICQHNLEPKDEFQVYTTILDGEGKELILPAPIPDKNWLRLRKIKELPYACCYPLNYFISVDNIELVGDNN